MAQQAGAYKQAQEAGATISRPIEDTSYGSREFGVKYEPNTKMYMAYRKVKGLRDRLDLERFTSLKQAKNYCKVLQKTEADDGDQD